MSVVAAIAGGPSLFEDEHDQFRASVRQFVDDEIVPRADIFRAAKRVSREVWQGAGELGYIGFMMPVQYGGGGVDDFRFNAVIDEEIARYGGPSPSLSLQNDVVGPYFSSLANDEQKARWLPGIISGELIVAVAMTEPGAGSDLAGIRTSAIRDGDDWIINGA